MSTTWLIVKNIVDTIFAGKDIAGYSSTIWLIVDILVVLVCLFIVLRIIVKR